MSRKNKIVEHVLRLLIVIHFVFALSHLNAQQTDTIELIDIEIKALKDPGKPIKQVLDSLLSSQIHTARVEQLLEKFSPILIRSYGGSGSAMATYQGFSPSQVPVLWNDIPTRAGITGVSDLSLFSLNPLQYISYGNSSLATQGMTGALSLDQKWNEDTLLFRSSFTAGSFGLFQGSILQQSLFKRGGLQFFGTGSGAKNDYMYSNYTVIPERREQQQHAQFSKGLFSQGWKTNSKNQKHHLHGIVEGYFNKREIPPTLLSPDNKALQKDGGLRSFVNWDYIGNHWKNSTSIAWMYSSLFYNDLSLIKSSVNKGNLFWFKEKLAREWRNKGYTEIGFDSGLDNIKSNNYEGNKSQWQIHPYIVQKYMPVSWINLVVQLKALFLQGHHRTITVMGGIDGQPIKEAPFKYFIYSRRNVRFPTLNDKYWQPGGNPDINEERAVNIEGGLQLDKMKIADKWSLSSLIKGYYTTAKDLIFWFPGNKVYWTPENIQKVKSKGVETELQVRFSHEQFVFATGLIFQFTSITNQKAIGFNDNSVGKQLLYIPRYSTKSYGLINYKGFSLMADLQYYSLRYITSDNSAYLPGYTLLNVQTGYSIYLKNEHTIEALFAMSNVTNKSYEEIAYRPQPGIYFTGTIIYQFNNKKS